MMDLWPTTCLDGPANVSCKLDEMGCAETDSDKGRVWGAASGDHVGWWVTDLGRRVVPGAVSV